MSGKACSIASWSLCASAGCDHEGLPPRERGGHVQQLPGWGRALGGDGVPGGRRSDRHCHSHQVCMREKNAKLHSIYVHGD